MAAATMPQTQALTSGQDKSAVELADELVMREPHAMLTVTGAVGELAALAHHVERRALLAGRRALWIDGRVHEEPWREAAAVLGVSSSTAGSVETTPVTRSATAVAAAICEALGGAVLIVHETQPTTWSRVLGDELERRSKAGAMRGAIVLLTQRRREIALHACLTVPGEQDLLRYFDALVQSGRQRLTSFDRLETLERWWTGGVAFEPATTALPQRARAALLSREARNLHARIAMVRSACDEALIDALGGRDARDELVDARWLTVDGNRVFLAEPVVRHDARDAVLVAEALVRSGADAWACMRAAELFALAGDAARAHTWAKQALERAPEAAARADFWRRLDALDTTASELTAYAELALDFGDAEQALTLARRAAAAGEGAQAFAVALALGRAVRARGDARAASAALEQAYELASSVDERARAALELGELALSRGDRQAAHRFASDAQSSSEAGTRLMASNLVGKMLLAEARWQEAESHFARDEHDAHRVGNEREALRARLNRAIAILSRGARSEARGLLELVLADGERIEDRRAVAFALANLSTLATLGHDYGSALSLLERAIDEVRALGDAERLARLILNLAELRLRLGLTREADQALAFARQACGAAMMGSIASLASFVAARAQLAGGNTLQAAAHLRDAVAAAERGSNGAKASESHRLGVRIALEDGDLPRAERHLTIAQQSGGGPDSEAELALLTARVERASGKPYGDEAARALALASGGDDHELMRQAHVICAQWAQDEGDRTAFQRHVQAAARLRDTVAGSLPPALRDSFLARRELVEQRALESGTVIEQSEPVTLRSGAPSRNMVGGSRVMRVLRTAIAKIGRSDATVLVLGESGTGKELVADALHAASARAGGPLVKMNCAALVETLLLSELFGHEKGAFTGAAGRKRGRFEQAHGGTIFLDEIGDISPKTQVALLRVLQERSFERVGGHTSVEVDVRVVCATHRDLRRMVEEGSFREDLYYRLCGVSLQVPALRERIEDLPELCQALLSRIASEQSHREKRLSREALEALTRHGWPGNVRELENALRAASLFSEGESIVLRDLTDNVEGLRYLGDTPSLAPPPSHTRLSPGSPTEAVYAQLREGTSLPDLKRTLERACIERALDEAGGNITKAAQLLGMKRPRLSQLVNQYSRERQEVAK